MRIDQSGHGRDFTQIDHLSVVIFQYLGGLASPHESGSVDHKRTVIDRCAIHRDKRAASIGNHRGDFFIVVLAAATNRLQASRQRNGRAARFWPVWSNAGSDFEGGRKSGGRPSSIPHKMVLRHRLSERQASFTRSWAWFSVSWRVTRYIPVCRFSVCRKQTGSAFPARWTSQALMAP